MNEPQVQVRCTNQKTKGAKKKKIVIIKGWVEERIVISAKPPGSDEWAEDQSFVE